MRSIAFPKMFNTVSTNIVDDKEATQSNLNNLLLSEKNEMLGDPFFGVGLTRYIHDQNNSIMDDMLIDDIYTAIAWFIPQLVVRRSDIKLVHDRNTLYATITGVNQLNFKTDMYDVVLLRDEGENT